MGAGVSRERQTKPEGEAWQVGEDGHPAVLQSAGGVMAMTEKRTADTHGLSHLMIVSRIPDHERSFGIEFQLGHEDAPHGLLGFSEDTVLAVDAREKPVHTIPSEQGFEDVLTTGGEDDLPPPGIGRRLQELGCEGMDGAELAAGAITLDELLADDVVGLTVQVKPQFPIEMYDREIESGAIMLSGDGWNSASGAHGIEDRHTVVRVIHQGAVPVPDQGVERCVHLSFGKDIDAYPSPGVPSPKQGGAEHHDINCGRDPRAE